MWCRKCKLKEADFVPYVGPQNPEILVVGEAPGYQETIQKKGFVGNSGQLIRKALENTIGENYEKSVGFANIVSCRPPENKTPTEAIIKSCSSIFEKTVTSHKPKKIFLYGNCAMKYFFGFDGTTYFHGKKGWDWERDCMLYVFWHPAYVLRRGGGNVLYVFEKKIEEAILDQDFKKPEIDTEFYDDFVGVDIETVGDLYSGKEYILSHAFVHKYWSKVSKDSSYYNKIYNIITHNGKYDLKWVNHLIFSKIFNCQWDLSRIKWYDTKVGEYLINENNPSRLEHLILKYTSLGNYKKLPGKYIKGKIKIDKRKSTILDLDPEVLKMYNYLDAYCLHKIKYEQLKEIKEQKLEEILKIFIEANKVFVKMEETGITLDRKQLKKNRLFIKRLLEKRWNKINRTPLVRGFLEQSNKEKINWRSPKQVRELLADYGRYQSPRKSKITGESSFNEEAIQELYKQYKDEGVFTYLLSIRKLEKIYSSYLQPLSELNKNIIHADYRVPGTDTGRPSCRKPNLQQIPNKGRIAQYVRSCFVSRPHHYLVEVDYKQLEVRIFAELTGDKLLIQTVGAEDVHTSFACELFNLKKEEVQKDIRSKAKTCVFGGVIYGGGGWIISKEVGCSVSEGNYIVDKFYSTYRKAAQQMDIWRNYAKKHSCIPTLFGNKRHLTYKTKRSDRQIINSPVQGTAGILNFLAQIKLNKIIDWDKCKMLLNTHDSILFEIHEDFLEKYIPVIKYTMENIKKLTVPLEVDVETGKNLNNMKEEDINEFSGN